MWFWRFITLVADVTLYAAKNSTTTSNTRATKEYLKAAANSAYDTTASFHRILPNPHSKRADRATAKAFCAKASGEASSCKEKVAEEFVEAEDTTLHQQETVQQAGKGFLTTHWYLPHTKLHLTHRAGAVPQSSQVVPHPRKKPRSRRGAGHCCQVFYQKLPLAYDCVTGTLTLTSTRGTFPSLRRARRVGSLGKDTTCNSQPHNTYSCRGEGAVGVKKVGWNDSMLLNMRKCCLRLGLRGLRVGLPLRSPNLRQMRRVDVKRRLVKWSWLAQNDLLK